MSSVDRITGEPEAAYFDVDRGIGGKLQATRSPLKDKPLRVPGQSVEDARRRLIEDRIEPPLLTAVLLSVLAAMEWWREYRAVEPSPVLFSFVAACGIGFAAWRVWKSRPRLRALRQALDGERAIGQYLELLGQRGYRVFHDLLGSGFNVDHVLIGPAGIFTIETKTWSKPRRGEARIGFDGHRVRVGSREPDERVVVQARAQANWMRELLAESTGRRFAVRPVVLFPGWFIEQSPGSTSEIWVLNPKALPEFLSRQSTALRPEEVQLASYHLSRFIRAKERGLH